MPNQVHSHEDLMRRAIQIAVDSVAQGGGPFGAVIARGGAVVAEGHNRVTISHDPTAHAEVVAIRRACEAIESFQLEDCIIYSSCEPCPMCLGAIYWARPKAIYFACNRFDAAKVGFDDQHIYDELPKGLDLRAIPTRTMLREEGLKAFAAWSESADKVEY